ncbi:MAG: hypothetical protein EAZ08_06755 [Cytophagales bacterium]|nr:MAG: hypothetical protein EAZ08_06755 [Cytophagales bacterium]
MKQFFLVFLFLAFSVSPSVFAQTDPSDFRNFPLVISLHFHSLSLPFKNLKSNFKNVGIGIGTEITHNGSNNWVQQFNVVWYRNKGIGNGIFFSSQVAWRPHLVGSGNGEIKAGLGYLLAFHPTTSFVQQEGKWIKADRKIKGMWAIPVGIGFGYYYYHPETFVSPFISYQMMLVKGYNASVPLVPQTLIQVGSRIHFQKK